MKGWKKNLEGYLRDFYIKNLRDGKEIRIKVGEYLISMHPGVGLILYKTNNGFPEKEVAYLDDCTVSEIKIRTLATFGLYALYLTVREKVFKKGFPIFTRFYIRNEELAEEFVKEHILGRGL